MNENKHICMYICVEDVCCANESGQSEKHSRVENKPEAIKDFKSFVMRLTGPPRPPVCNYRTFIPRVVSIPRNRLKTK